MTHRKRKHVAAIVRVRADSRCVLWRIASAAAVFRLEHAPMSAQDIVLAGKHRGSTFAEALEHDKNYCHWICHTTSLPRSLLPFRRWIQRTHGGILLVGKHKNKTFAEVHSEYPETPFCVF